MTYQLLIGEKNYSSWSMRAWLLMKHIGAPFEEVTVPLYRPDSQAAVRAFGGQTGLVPVLRDGATVVWDTLAIFEYLHERYPSVWPAAARDRALARCVSGELHSGFSALREAMPCNTRARGLPYPASPQVSADIARAEAIWGAAGRADGPWLFGAFCGADIMFAPVAARFQTYGVTLTGSAAAAYQARLLSHPLVAEWLALGAAEPDSIPIRDLLAR